MVWLKVVGWVKLLVTICIPEGPLSANQIILEDDASDGPALTNTSTISNEEARTVAAGQEVLMFLASVDNGLQLQGWQVAIVQDALWDGELVPDVWWSDTGQWAGLHHWVWVLLS